MVNELCSGPCLVLEIQGPDAPQKFREFCGPADPVSLTSCLLFSVFFFCLSNQCKLPVPRQVLHRTECTEYNCVYSLISFYVKKQPSSDEAAAAYHCFHHSDAHGAEADWLLIISMMVADNSVVFWRMAGALATFLDQIYWWFLFIH